VCLCSTDSEVKPRMDTVDGSSAETMNEFCYLGNKLSVDGDVEAAVTARFHSGSFNFQLIGLLSCYYRVKIFPCCCEQRFTMHACTAKLIQKNKQAFSDCKPVKAAVTLT